MKRFTFSIVFLTCSISLSAEEPAAELENIVDNAAKIYELAALIEKQHSLPAERSADPWGTPYRMTVDPAKRRYSITSAGPDKRFDQTPVDDTLFDTGKFVRSNHERAIAEAKKLAPRGQDRFLRPLELAKAHQTMIAVRRISTALAAYLAEYDRFPEGDAFALPGLDEFPRQDAWGTPLRVTTKGSSWRIVSAGADKTFDAGTDLARDLVNENGRFLAAWDSEGDAVAASLLRFERAKREFERVAGSRPVPITR